MEKKIKIITANDRPEDVLELMEEYIDWMIQNDEEIREVLANQNLDDEIADINSKYAPPEGRLYLALLDDEPVGCIALTNISDQIGAGDHLAEELNHIRNTQTKNSDLFVCECKRLFVRPSARGNNIGKMLMGTLLSEAKKIGYSYMRLDSFPFMASAVKMYDRYGFYPIGNYCGNPSENAIFRELDLKGYNP